jgi:hypothetical protein
MTNLSREHKDLTSEYYGNGIEKRTFIYIYIYIYETKQWQYNHTTSNGGNAIAKGQSGDAG